MHRPPARKEKERMKKLWNAARIGILALMFAMLFGMGDTAEAAPPSGKVSNLKQTEILLPSHSARCWIIR